MEFPFLLLSALLGILLGAFANYAASAWAWTPRRENPWCASGWTPPWWYRIPVIGWLGMRKETARFGRRVWLRPLLVELAMAAFAVWFFQKSVAGPAVLLFVNEIPVTPTAVWSLVARFIFQMLFVALMLAASLIDFDEKTIPDRITIGGTLFALICACIFPLDLGTYRLGNSDLPLTIAPVNGLLDFPLTQMETGDDFLVPLTASAPNPPLDVLRSPFGGSFGLISALVCWWGWCFALMDRRWRTGRGTVWAWRIFWLRLLRTRSTRRLFYLGEFGTFAIIFFWMQAGPQWVSLWSALLGMGISGAFIWMVRIGGKLALDREAMGFGDVTLMAMFGAFLGWQPCVVLFFIAPFAGILLGLLLILLFKDPEIPFGPFLCAAALLTMLYWPMLWALTMPIFKLGSLLVTLGLGLWLLMVLLLSLILWVEKKLGIVP
ncbi:MAG: prepilin peptidase [Planctomycetaceae bacterium]|nr:prepilin peptidase [Planctomycetaceae bacterium]